MAQLIECPGGCATWIAPMRIFCSSCWRRVPDYRKQSIVFARSALEHRVTDSTERNYRAAIARAGAELAAAAGAAR